MECLQIGKVIFYPTEIVILKKKGDIKIHIDEIEFLYYNKPKLLDYLPIFNIGSIAKQFRIRFKKSINGQKDFIFGADYQDVLKLQKFFQMEISIF